MIENLLIQIEKKFGAAIVKIVEFGKQPTLQVDKAYILDLCLFLRDHPDFYFDFLANITAVDYYPEHRFALVYNLSSIPNQISITLRVELENENRDANNLPEIDSLSAVYKTAEWHEREAFDLMGIFFTNHPDLRRILLPDDWQGFPLRKDYEDPEMYHGINIKN